MSETINLIQDTRCFLWSSFNRNASTEILAISSYFLYNVLDTSPNERSVQMGRRGDVKDEKSPLNNFVRRIHVLADRIYATDMGKASACKVFISEMKQVILKENFVPGGHNPFEAMAQGLRTRFPEVWRGDRDYSGEKAYKVLMSTPAKGDDD